MPSGRYRTTRTFRSPESPVRCPAPLLRARPRDHRPPAIQGADARAGTVLLRKGESGPNAGRRVLGFLYRLQATLGEARAARPGSIKQVTGAAWVAAAALSRQLPFATNETGYKGFSVYGVAHFPVNTVGSTDARIHLDGKNAFTNYSTLEITLRHEAAHVFYGGETAARPSEWFDSVATSCSM